MNSALHVYATRAGLPLHVVEEVEESDEEQGEHEGESCVWVLRTQLDSALLSIHGHECHADVQLKRIQTLREESLNLQAEVARLVRMNGHYAKLVHSLQAQIPKPPVAAHQIAR